MAVTHLFNTGRTDEEEAALLRQDVTDSLRRALTGALDGQRSIPVFLREAFEREAWKLPRILGNGGVLEPVSFHEYIHAHAPIGLGLASYDVIRPFIKDDVELLGLYDEACKRPPGGANNPQGLNQHTPKAPEVTVYNIHVDQPDPEPEQSPPNTPPERPAGTSKQAGLRRLSKAANDDPKAAELHQKVLSGATSVNAAAKEMGWRKDPTPLQLLQSAWRRAPPEDRQQFIEWLRDNEDIQR